MGKNKVKTELFNQVSFFRKNWDSETFDNSYGWKKFFFNSDRATPRYSLSKKVSRDFLEQTAILEHLKTGAHEKPEQMKNGPVNVNRILALWPHGITFETFPFAKIVSFNTSTHQHINVSTHQHINTSTHQHINTSTHQHFKTSTHQHNTSTHQHINTSTHHHINRITTSTASTRQHINTIINTSTLQHINTSTHQHINTSTHQLNTSTRQHINTSTHQHTHTHTSTHQQLY